MSSIIENQIRSIRTIHQACPVTPPESTNINPREQYRRQYRRVGGGFQTVSSSGKNTVKKEPSALSGIRPDEPADHGYCKTASALKSSANGWSRFNRRNGTILRVPAHGRSTRRRTGSAQKPHRARGLTMQLSAKPLKNGAQGPTRTTDTRIFSPLYV